jgi:predicted RNase H-like nuclease (RuvC/YqgF family)
VVAPKPPVSNLRKAPPPSELVREPVPPPETPLERAIRAEQELDAMKYRQHNEIYHRDNKIENLKMRNEALQNRIAELEAALEAAQARIRELEEEAAA